MNDFFSGHPERQRGIAIQALGRQVLRAIAVAIAALAIVDPAITSNRSVKPMVVVTALDSIRDASLADRVSKTVSKEFTVARSPLAGASAAVIVGDRLPSANDDYPTPTFAVVPDTTAPSVSIERLTVPAVVPSASRVPVVVQIGVHGANGRSLDVTLRAGPSVADRVTRQLSRNDTTLTVPLSFVPTTAGAAAVRVSATLSGAGEPAIADAAVTVQNQRWAVLFFDARPSWTSTFVRRAIERDPRFIVTSRVVTSRNVSTDAGRPPANLDDRVALSRFDVIVIGAPEGLSPAEVTGLDAFMRRRGGSVVLLLDQRVAGPYDRLANVSAWSSSNASSTTLASARSDSAALRATDIAWPTALPAGARVIVGGTRPVVWDSPVGAGRLVVSGALDAWRFRDPRASGFDRFWRALLAEAADAAPPPVSVTLSTPIATPGEAVEVHAVVRDAALAPGLNARASIAAVLQPGTPIRLWPEPDVGEFRGTVRAPRTPGVYRIAVTEGHGGATADAPLIVASEVLRAAPSAGGLLAEWATAHGGQILRAAELERLPAALRVAVRPPSRLETWHPMRSAWWIVPFVLALSGEWWMRRRRGLR